MLGSSMEMEPGTILNEHLRFQARACLPQGKAPGNTGDDLKGRKWWVQW